MAERKKIHYIDVGDQKFISRSSDGCGLYDSTSGAEDWARVSRKTASRIEEVEPASFTSLDSSRVKKGLRRPSLRRVSGEPRGLAGNDLLLRRCRSLGGCTRSICLATARAEDAHADFGPLKPSSTPLGRGGVWRSCSANTSPNARYPSRPGGSATLGFVYWILKKSSS